MGGLSSLANELGISESQAARGAAALLPALLGGFQKQADRDPSGLAGLGARLGALGGSSLMDNVLGLLDGNGDGNPLDDILRMAGNHTRK
jgi:hypothetical protein